MTQWSQRLPPARPAIKILGSKLDSIPFRVLMGIGGGFAVTALFPITAELMPARHRRAYAAIYEIPLASSFTVLPLAKPSRGCSPACGRRF